MFLTTGTGVGARIKDEDGEITRYFVEKFIAVSAKAIPTINEVEGCEV